MHSIADSATHNGPLSSALAGTFRGKLCDVILRNRNVTTFEKDQVIYDAADQHQTFFFLQKGFVKVGSITEDDHELIYDVRKAGDIVGELCASGQQRQDRAVALERLSEPRSSLCLSTKFSRSYRRTGVSWRGLCRCFASLCRTHTIN